ncbi:hypothetical protein [Lacticaseibacillus jixiensis]|uniref:hypothetical protein n=1 Tax=Lacticaseibacillus jixiensis TaxID=3231926 RepID=UPI0036F300D8
MTKPSGFNYYLSELALEGLAWCLAHHVLFVCGFSHLVKRLHAVAPELRVIDSSYRNRKLALNSPYVVQVATSNGHGMRSHSQKVARPGQIVLDWDNYGSNINLFFTRIALAVREDARFQQSVG